jgi:putative addiction module CopG family antidote
MDTRICVETGTTRSNATRPDPGDAGNGMIPATWRTAKRGSIPGASTKELNDCAIMRPRIIRGAPMVTRPVGLTSATVKKGMANPAHMIELPEDLRAFAEEQVRAGKAGSVDEVVRDALEQKKLEALRAELDAGIAELDAGRGVETTPDDLLAEASREAGLGD